MPCIAFLTYKKQPELMADDALCVPLLASRGITVEAHPWDSKGVDWKKFDAVIVRSTWDYFLRQEEFLAWVAGLERAGVRILNPAPVLRWNTTKTYLRELEKKGIAIVPTLWLDRPEQPLPDFGKLGWSEIVLKAAIGAGGFDTSRHLTQNRAEIETARAKLAGRYPLLVQPFLKEILTEGEFSFFFLGGKFSHAVSKKPAAGNFLVQYDHGGTATPFDASPAAIAVAARVIAAAPKPLLYARVDMIPVQGTLLLGELEITEPSLFLDRAPHAPQAFVDAIVAALQTD